MSYDFLMKIAIIGNTCVGKSALTRRFSDNKFIPHFDATIGVDFTSIHVRVDSKIVKLQIWDTAGQENFAPIIRSYYRGVAGVLLVFDVGDKRTFDNLNFWLHELETNKDPNHPCPVIVVGHKIDKTHRAVSRDEAEEFAKLKGITYMEASSKTGQNVDDIFHEIVRKILENFNDGFAIGTRLNPLGEAKKRLELVKDDKEHRYNCCCMF